MVGTAVDFIAGRLQYKITAEDDTKTGVNSAIANVTRLDAATNRALTQFRRQYKEGLITFDQYGSLVAATFNNVANTAPSALNKINTSVARTGGILKGFGGLINGVFYGLAAGFAIGAVYSFIGAIQSAISAVANFIEQSAQLSGAMEMIKISFETLSGSASMAKEMYDWLWSVSLKSPFQFQDIADATRQLQGYGLTWEQIKRTILATGDVTAALGRSSEDYGRFLMALGQVKAFGTLRGQEAMQLVNAGIPVWDILAKHYNKSIDEVRQLAENKELGSGDEILNVLLTAFESPKYKGAMERMNKTYVGQMTQFKETIQYVMIQVGDVFNTMFLPILTFVNNKLQEWLPRLKELGGLIKGVMDDLKSFWGSITNTEGDAGIAKYLKEVLSSATVFSGAMGGPLVAIYSAIRFIIDLVTNSEFWHALYNFAKAWMLIFHVIGSACSNFIDSLSASIDKGANEFVKFLVSLSEIVLTIATILTDNSRSMGERLGDIFRWIVSSIIDIIQLCIRAIGSLLIQAGANFLLLIQDTLNKIIRFINNSGEILIDNVKKIIEFLANFGSGFFNLGLKLGGSFVNGILNKAGEGFSNLVNKINNWIGGLADKVKEAFGVSSVRNIDFGSVSTPSDIFSGLDFSNLHLREVDFSNIIKDYEQGSYKLLNSILGYIDDLQEKYGLNVTLEDLQKKYNVNLEGFKELLKKLKNTTQNPEGGGGDNSPFSENTPLNELRDSINNLSDKIDGKDFKFTLYFDVKVENAGNEEEVRRVGDTLQESVKKAISTAMAKGVTP